MQAYSLCESSSQGNYYFHDSALHTSENVFVRKLRGNDLNLYMIALTYLIFPSELSNIFVAQIFVNSKIRITLLNI